MPDHGKVYDMLGIDAITKEQFIEIMDKPQGERDAALAQLHVSQTIRDSLKKQGLL